MFFLCLFHANFFSLKIQALNEEVTSELPVCEVKGHHRKLNESLSYLRLLRLNVSLKIFKCIKYEL